jgi:hypothetical protein
MPRDLLPADLAFSAAGGAAVGFGAQDEDDPADAQVFRVVRSARGRLGRVQPVAGAQQLLDLGYDGSTLKLLTGSAPSGQTCCTSASIVSVAADGRQSERAVTDSLAGATLGRLLVLPHHVTVIALAAENGVWVARTDSRHRSLGARALTPAGALPEALAATTLPGGRSLVAWTATDRPAASPPRAIFVAGGSETGMPGPPRVELTVPRGHEIDELQVAGGTVAYLESWFDRAGAFHSQAAAADLKPPVRPRTFAVAGGLAAGLSLAANQTGDRMLAWKTCDALGACRVRAAGRPAGRRFGSIQKLGAIDASQSPVTAVAPHGEAVVAWIANGHVFAAEQPRPGLAFARVQKLSKTDYAYDLTLGFAPTGTAMAVWTQGTLNSSVMAAILR